jgi:predicted glycosyltransferase involved in capsule biosynthesis
MEHLVDSISKWIAITSIDEIIIVDWNNPEPISNTIKPDNKIKIIRVISEPKWILSYAYNIGIQCAKNELIFKCDADCVPNEKIFNLIPTNQYFYSGYWKNGLTVGKASVNGQCYFRKEDFEKVNGYSEYIRTYGRDDEDLYDRLQYTGLKRLEIKPDMLEIMNHSNEMRTSNQFDAEIKTNKLNPILSNPSYNEMKNYYVKMNIA